MSPSKAKPRKPSESIQKCPACGSKELYRMEVDVLCLRCDWLSAEMHVECGGMDNIFSAYIDHFCGGSPGASTKAPAKIGEVSVNPLAMPTEGHRDELELVSA